MDTCSGTGCVVAERDWFGGVSDLARGTLTWFNEGVGLCVHKLSAE